MSERGRSVVTRTTARMDETPGLAVADAALMKDLKGWARYDNYDLKRAGDVVWGDNVVGTSTGQPGLARACEAMLAGSGPSWVSLAGTTRTRCDEDRSEDRSEDNFQMRTTLKVSWIDD